MKQDTNTWLSVIDKIGPKLSENGHAAEETDSFAHENYKLLQENKIFSAMVPKDLGGGGASLTEMAHVLKRIAAYHPSTALSCSMHQHIVAANVYNNMHGRPGKALLEKVAANELILVSTGAGDWLASNGELTKTDGGFLYNGMKHFCSGSPGADLFVTSGPYEDPEEGWQVLHFPIPTKAEGVTLLDNWKAMGMRATGSDSVKFENVFIPQESVVAKRPRGDFHAMWCTILPVALPLIMSVYTSIAETAASKAIDMAKNSKKAPEPATPYIIGEMSNALLVAQMAHDQMLSIADDWGFEASTETVNEMVKLKAIGVEATKKTVEKAVESASGAGFMRAGGLEQLFRDVQASHFHPLQEKRQLLFTGSVELGLEPPAQAF